MQNKVTQNFQYSYPSQTYKIGLETRFYISSVKYPSQKYENHLPGIFGKAGVLLWPAKSFAVKIVIAGFLFNNNN